MIYEKMPKYFLVQLGWAKVRPKTTRSIFEVRSTILEEEKKIGVKHPSDGKTLSVQMLNYSNEMDCLQPVDHEPTGVQGMPSPVMERVSLAGDICISCPAAAHCIIKLIHDSPRSSSILPEELKTNTYHW